MIIKNCFHSFGKKKANQQCQWKKTVEDNSLIDKFIIPPHVSVKPGRAIKSREQFFAQGARVMGDVRLGMRVSVWYNAVIRADVNYIEIGDDTNIQDGCVLHVTNNHPCIIGKKVTLAHSVNIHGALVEDLCLIGIGAIVLTGAVIGRGALIASGAVVREKQIVPPLTLMAGVPAVPIKTLPLSIIEEHHKWADKYIQLAKLHQKKISNLYASLH